MGRGRELVNRFVLGVDVEKYSARNVRQQDDTQRALDRILDEAAAEAGLDRQEWVTMPGGDGEHAILPVDVNMVSVVSGLVTQLDDLLTAHNEDHSDNMKIRLRVAMHMDTILRSAMGYAGPGLVVLSRLLDAEEFKRALASRRDASLALLVSEPVYQSVVESGLGGLRPGRFRLLEIDNPAKRFRQSAYLYIPPSTGPEPREPGSAGGVKEPSPPGRGNAVPAAGPVYNTYNNFSDARLTGDVNIAGRDLSIAGGDFNVGTQAGMGD